jgi:hypothetical protein
VSSINVSTALSPVVPIQAHAHDAWREAELQVHARWDAYLVADRRSRRTAFASYLMALEAEAAAAEALAQTHITLYAAS